MNLFITGGTGYIGEAVTRALVAGGHRVSALVRSEARAAQAKALGATPVTGDLSELASLTAQLAPHDALVHIASAEGPQRVALDSGAIDALLAATRAPGSRVRALVYTSGVFVLGGMGERAADEDASTTHAAQAVTWRPSHEQRVLGAATAELATSVIRPGMVYGGREGLVSEFFRTAAAEGAAAHVGDGNNRWCLIHRDDVARLYRLVLERRARGIFHVVDGHPLRVTEIARAAALAAGKGGATRSIPREEARAQMGAFADALCDDRLVTTKRAVELGFEPSHGSFIDAARDAWREWSAG